MAGDDQDQAEALDADKLDEALDDPEGALAYPPDRPLGVLDYGTTAQEERIDEPLEERLSREVPDPSAFPPTSGWRGPLDADVEGDLLDDETALDDLDGSGPIGRLVEPGAEDDAVLADDVEPDAVATAVDANDLSAEEAAVNPTGEPPMGQMGDGYVEGER
jgi:hypothetical protein